MTLKVCVAGATGWAGSALALGVHHADDMALVSGVSRSHAGKTLGQALGKEGVDVPVFATVAQALSQPCDVLVEYTKPESAKANVLCAIEHGIPVVLGTSGLTDQDLAEIDQAARQRNVGVLACGNFAITAVLLQKFSQAAAKYLPNWEIIDYGSATKVDIPSGTGRELAHLMSQVREPQVTVSADQAVGPAQARGANVAGSQVHAVRLPGFVLGIDVVFGLPDQTLVIRHNAGTSAQPYVDGGLLAIRKVSGLQGLHRGLDKVMDL